MPQNSPGFVQRQGGGLCVCAPMSFIRSRRTYPTEGNGGFGSFLYVFFHFSLFCQRDPTSNESWLQTGHHSPKLDTSTFTGSTAVVTLQEPQQDRTNREPTPVSMPKSLPLLPIGPPKWSQSFIRVLDSHFHPLLLTSLIISVLSKHSLIIRNPEWACHTHTHAYGCL